MAINHSKKVVNVLSLATKMKKSLEPLRSTPSVSTSRLIDAITNFQTTYGIALLEYQALGRAGMSQAEISQAFGLQVYPAPIPGTTFNNVAQARNALIVSYDNDVWPLFNGVTKDRVAGNHVDTDVVLPASFKTAVNNMVAALEDLVE